MPEGYIDLYCERLAPGLLGEPLNALTNLLFVLAAILLARDLARSSQTRRDDWLLAGLVAAVGLGSLVFHMAATRATSVLDKVFIALFILVFFQRWLTRVAGLGLGSSLAGAAVFVAASLGIGKVVPPDTWNGSVLYLPALLGLAGVAAWTRRIGQRGAAHFALALGVFVLAVTFRSIDLAVCDRFPWGTHFLWHSLNALVLFLCCRGLRRSC
jgi:hypothetical protein